MRFFIGLLTRLAGLLSWESADALGGWIGRLLLFLGIRKDVVMENLKQVFDGPGTPPDRRKTSEEIKEICRKCYENFGRVIMMYLRAHLMDEKFFAERWEVEGEERLRAALACGKGVVAIGGHIGVWEFAIMKVGHMSIDAALIAKDVKNQAMNRWVIDLRRRNKVRTFPPKESRGEIVECLKRKGFVVSVMDQNMRSRQGVFVDFLGRPASTVKSTPGIVHEAGSLVIAGYARRIGPARYKLFITPEIPWISHEDPERERLLNTQNYTRHLERVILEKPEDWFWLHRRWKRRPEGEAAAPPA